MYHQKSYQSSDGLTLAYRDYPGPGPGLGQGPGPGERAVLVCLHGLTRNSADFEDFAEIFGADHRLLAVDVRGRGLSDPDPVPERYHVGTYVADLIALLDREGLERVVCVGTSMGGLMTMVLAAQAPDRLQGAVLNDIGAEIGAEGLTRITAYVGRDTVLPDWPRAVAALKLINARFFPDFTGQDWQRWARRLIRERPDGQLEFAYDPQIGEVARAAGGAPADLWALFDALKPIPTLAVRGAMSDILTADTLAAMQARKPDLRTVEVPNRGHAPILNEPVAVDAIKAFLGDLPR